MAMADRGESRKRPVVAIHNVHPEKLRKGPDRVDKPILPLDERLSQAEGAGSAYLAGRTPMHTGRLRTWNSAEQWGYIFSEVHNCDVFFDGAEYDIVPPLCEGDSMI